MPAQKNSSPKKPKQSNRRPVRREVGALVCFLLAVFTFFSLFGAEAWLIDHLSDGVRFVVGAGFGFVPFAGLAAAVILLFHRSRPVALRTACVFIIPVLAGILIGLFGEHEGWFPLAYWLAGGLRAGLSTPVAAVLLIIGILVCVFIALRLSPVAIYDAIRNRTVQAYEPPPVPERRPERAEKPARPEKPERKKQRPDFDVPIYTGPDAEPEAPLPVGILPGRGDHVRTPAELTADKPEIPPIPPKGVKVEPIPPPREQDAPPWEEPVPVEAAISVKDAAPPVVPEPAAMPELKPVASVSIGGGDEAPEPYRFPSVSLLTATRPALDGMAGKNEEELKHNAERLVAALQSFGIGASVLNVTRGPSVARYEIEPESGVKLASLTSRADDIALSLGAVGVHIAPVPGKANVVGIEVPNRMVSTVYIRDLIDSEEFRAMDSPTSFVLGRDITGQNIVADMAKLTHLLIAGTTGSGKSVCMNTLITSMLYKASPDDLRFIMVDPKMVELGVYNGIPHLLSPVVTEPKRAAEALEWAVAEMDGRYNLLMQRGKRDIISYNEEVSREPDGVTMPRIVIIIDEMADLMMVAHKEVETAVARIAQKARACGVHLILATQRPEAKVVTGIIKANTPSRIAFAVKGNLDSRIILDIGGAEKLVGRGDMLFLPIGAPKPVRVQGCFVSDKEVTSVVEYIKGSASANYSEEMLAHLNSGASSAPASTDIGVGGSPPDPMLPAAIEVIMESGQGSTSYLQRRLKLGYARAARLMDEMEERGIVGPFEGSKPRQVLMTPEEWEKMKGP
ncbi:MAG: DNA translocase FtsK [Oscillospiraceae bacterium]|jgi:S-DNA-T family DNA segregation ATPase FtsK/SpoIIIE|nr:DNA translocase FtsK [Oscillospiraceae bacterium]